MVYGPTNVKGKRNQADAIARLSDVLITLIALNLDRAGGILPPQHWNHCRWAYPWTEGCSRGLAAGQIVLDGVCGTLHDLGVQLLG